MRGAAAGMGPCGAAADGRISREGEDQRGRDGGGNASGKGRRGAAHSETRDEPPVKEVVTHDDEEGLVCRKHGAGRQDVGGVAALPRAFLQHHKLHQHPAILLLGHLLTQLPCRIAQSDHHSLDASKVQVLEQVNDDRRPVHADKLLRVGVRVWRREPRRCRHECVPDRNRRPPSWHAVLAPSPPAALDTF
eukprot:scaffold31417_cov90-Isochrysis_galbana.AAC.2